MKSRQTRQEKVADKIALAVRGAVSTDTRAEICFLGVVRGEGTLDTYHVHTIVRLKNEPGCSAEPVLFEGEE